MTSILITVKKALGLDEDYTPFDMDIIMHINGVFMTLNMLGVGPVQGYSITGTTETWEDFLGDRLSDMQAVMTYTYLRVRLLFDPPQNSFLVSSLDSQRLELEWRLNVQQERRDINVS